MKIRKLAIKNYKIFDDITFDFTDDNGKTKETIILAGINGTGKTTVLELINDIFNGHQIKEVKEDFELFVELDLSSVEWYDAFLEQLQKNDMDYFAHTEIGNGRVSLQYLHKTSSRKTVDFKKFTDKFETARKKHTEKVTGIYRYSSDKVKNKADRGDDSFFREVSFSTHKEDMKSLILKPIQQKIFNNLNTPPKQIIEQEIDTINRVFKKLSLNTRFTNIDADELIFTSRNHQSIRFEDLSSGEKQICFMGFFLQKFNAANAMIVIDEPEDSLHPSWQNKIVDFYSGIGTNNQLILATHSPQVIASARPDCIYLLKPEGDTIVVKQPKYSKGHSVPYVLSEIMETDYQDTYVNDLVNRLLQLIRHGEHTTDEGQKLMDEINNLSPESEERIKVEFSIERYNAIGR